MSNKTVEGDEITYSQMMQPSDVQILAKDIVTLAKIIEGLVQPWNYEIRKKLTEIYLKYEDVK